MQGTTGDVEDIADAYFHNAALAVRAPAHDGLDSGIMADSIPVA
jgi:hypothetical protein